MPKKYIRPLALIILDGFGKAPAGRSNAIYQANTPHLTTWLKEYPNTLLEAAGEAVGLPAKYIGNSQVGHSTIGSGRIIEQNLVRIHKSIQKKTLQYHPIIASCFSELALSHKTLHIMGLLSDAGVHSHISHLFAYIDSALYYNVNSIMIHVFLDGRDVPPKSAKKYLEELEKKIYHTPCSIASITGRFYAMDRDNHWERTGKTYAMLTRQHTQRWRHWQDALNYYYQQKISDEFIPPTSFSRGPLIKERDGILFFNFRPDRARQLTASFVIPNFTMFKKKNLNLSFFISATDYDHNQYPTQVLFENIPIKNTLKEILSKYNKTIFTIAETEKYAHVTYFFDGGQEKKFQHETRILIPSIPVKNYVDYPEMSAKSITTKVIESLQKKPFDFYLINYANADMVGHSGNLQATIKAIEFLDTQLEKLYNIIIKEKNGTMIITGDHGNAEEMYDKKTDQVNTAHTNNPVPFIVLNKDLKNKSTLLNLKQLSDIAPFILQLMNLEIPQEMKKH